MINTIKKNLFEFKFDCDQFDFIRLHFVFKLVNSESKKILHNARKINSMKKILFEIKINCDNLNLGSFCLPFYSIHVICFKHSRRSPHVFTITLG